MKSSGPAFFPNRKIVFMENYLVDPRNCTYLIEIKLTIENSKDFVSTGFYYLQQFQLLTKYWKSLSIAKSDTYLTY
jgi:hypothetical protein